MSKPHSSDSLVAQTAFLRLRQLIVLLVLSQALALAAASKPVIAPSYTAKPGPWGELICTRFVIEPPESQIDNSRLTPRQTVWNFKGYTAESLLALWHSVELTDAQRKFIDDERNWTRTPDGILITPTSEFVLSLNRAARTTIYTKLAEFDENPDQHEPYRFRADASDEWFRNSNLSPASIALVKQLLYQRGTSLVFSDPSILMEKTPDFRERTRLLKTLARKATLLVKIRLQPDSDIDALVAYWGRGLRAKDLQPLLYSLAKAMDGGTSLDIVHLLPILPRSLLYTYPAPDDPGVNDYLDCHWTSLNFFNRVPDERYQHIDLLASAFLNDYYVVTGSPTFGDIILILLPNGTLIHSCVYVADDIVFTKNGFSSGAPWILMNLADVLAYYPSEQSLQIQTCRAKQAGQPSQTIPR